MFAHLPSVMALHTQCVGDLQPYNKNSNHNTTCTTMVQHSSEADKACKAGHNMDTMRRHWLDFRVMGREIECKGAPNSANR
jgi:hypothetical protein